MQSFRRSVCLLLCCFIAASWSPGCSRKDRTSLGKVSGTVAYRGKPVAAGTLIFEVAGARPAHGRIVDGKIVEVTTYAAGDGVPLGLARIAVYATPPEDPAAAAKSQERDVFKSLIPAKYNDPATSGLTLQVVAGENTLTLDLP